jgi:FkbM family methyltransferase
MSNSLHFGQKLRFVYRAWRYRWRVERAEIAFLLRHVPCGGTCLDIGGHKGAFTYWMQKQVGPDGRVFTFEPQPELADYLLAAKEALRFQHVEIVHAAVSSSPGTCQLFRPTNAPTPAATLEHETNSDYSLTVPRVSLDHFFQDVDHDPIRFIKCDVEGHERDVFRGAENVLTTDRPTLLFECEQRHQSARPIGEVFDYLHALGYEGEFFRNGRLHKLSHFDAAQNVHGQRSYAYNFLFRPRNDCSLPGIETSRRQDAA